MIVLKAMGMESDQEVVQMIGRDPRYSELLLPSIEVPNWSGFNFLESIIFFSSKECLNVIVGYPGLS